MHTSSFFIVRVVTLAATSCLALAAGASASCVCATDLNGDGVTDGGDLGQLLAAFGGPGSADFDQNGVVDGADLGILLAAFGSCPTTLANDTCAGAIDLEGQTVVVPFCNAGATTDPFSVVDCGVASTINQDIWYRYTPEKDGLLVVSTCGSANFDTVLGVYKNFNSPNACSCPSLTGGPTILFACNDDTCEHQAFMEIPANAGHCYTIRLGSFGTVTGEGELLVKNIHQGDRQDIPLSLESLFFQVVNGTNADDTALEGDESTCALNDLADRWYSFPAPCSGVVTFSTCSFFTDFDTTLAAYVDGVEVACNDDFDGPGCDIDGNNRKSEVSVFAVSGQEIKVRVSGFNGAIGDFDMTVAVQCE